jgi:RimK family alpha-L-glutamate ligase
MTRNKDSWSSTQLRQSLVRHHVSYACLRFSRLAGRIGYGPSAGVGRIDLLKDANALIVRPIGKGSLEELVFRMDLLHRLERSGLYILNPPKAIEHCVDKYSVLAVLEENGVPVPRTATTESVSQALKAFDELGKDVVVKPIFGSRGEGTTRLVDREIASTAFRAIAFNHGVMYVQEFVDHGFSDIRAFVLGDNVIAAMRRTASSWKTNYSQGARPESISLEKSVDDLVIKSAKAVGCKLAGVDILESKTGPLVVEINSQPGWKGLQSVTKFNVADRVVEFVLSELKK